MIKPPAKAPPRLTHIERTGGLGFLGSLAASKDQRRQAPLRASPFDRSRPSRSALLSRIRRLHQPPPTFSPAAGHSRRRAGRKVLVVDDQLEALVSTAELFRMMGYEVLAAGSGDEAIGILKRVSDIEVLFTDVFMPDMDGVRLAREARRLLPGINVILVSGFPATAMELHGGEPGEFHFLMKPFLMSEVAIVLRR